MYTEIKTLSKKAHVDHVAPFNFRCPGYACMTGFACPKIEGPYKRESVEQFGINLGDVDELEIGCPLQG